MKVNTNELTGDMLNWAVAYCENKKLDSLNPLGNHLWLGGDYNGHWSFRFYSPSQGWDQGGEIFEKLVEDGLVIQATDSRYTDRLPKFKGSFTDWNTVYYSKTVLEVAMKCYVDAIFGKEVEVPDEIAMKYIKS